MGQLWYAFFFSSNHEAVQIENGLMTNAICVDSDQPVRLPSHIGVYAGCKHNV